jgi:hypothetical protein
MNLKKITTKVLGIYVVLVVISSYITYTKLVSGWGDFDPLTAFLSITFAWQAIYAIIFSAFGSVSALFSLNIRLFIVCPFSAAIPLFLFSAAYEVQESGRNVTDGMAPSGPVFNCLTWKEPINPNTEEFSTENATCVLFHIPDYNKYWFDQSASAGTRNLTSYYLTFFVFQGLLYMPLLIWQRKNITQYISKPT